MSNDLISRSALHQCLSASINTGKETFDADLIHEMIDYVPTAYDIDKVVKRLAEKSRFIDDINEHGVNCIACVIGQKDAIEIIEKGGME